MRENTFTTAIGVIGVAAIGVAGGVMGEKYHTLKNTPEDTIRKLEEAKDASKKAKAEADISAKANQQALADLKRTKKEYQAEVHDEIETQVRTELADYISKADETYEKAKRDAELAELKLELARKIARGGSGNPTDVTIALGL